MSVRVLTAAFAHSRAEVGSRLVVIALADSAHDDGVTWISQEEIARKTLLSEAHVRECLRGLEDLAEIEMRKAQRGRRRINVYRVLMPGLAEIAYDRLPFSLAAPFTTADIPRSSESPRPRLCLADDRGYDDVSRARASEWEALTVNRTVKTPPIESPPANRPGKVAGKRVTDAEYEQAQAILDEWNAQTRQKISAKEWIAKLVMRIREYPDVTLKEHQEIILLNLADPWWDGPPSPSVVYGNGAQFERAMLTGRPGPPGQARRRRGVTAAEAARILEADNAGMLG